MKIIFLVSFTVIVFSGCSSLGVGDVSSAPCDGACDFKEAGLCADAISIYTHRKQLKNRKVKEHWFSKDEDPYVDDSQNGSNFSKINEEEIGK